ncbi:MAG: hypothetical protein WC831_00935 [Parcubacteria group bacterium]|jgi:hypothetical protein
MSAIWLYVPPIILLAALIGLTVVLGKKTAAIKKFEAQRPLKSQAEAFPGQKNKGERFKMIGQGILRTLETLLYYIRVAFRKSEEALNHWLRQIKERRTGKKNREEVLFPGEEIKTPDLTESDISFVSEDENIDISIREAKKPETLAPGVVVRKKPEIPPAIIKEEPAPEDKVVEEALIHRIAENPKDIEAYRDLGDYYLMIGNIKDSKESFKMVLRLRPRDLKAKTSLKEIEMRMRLGN